MVRETKKEKWLTGLECREDALKQMQINPGVCDEYRFIMGDNDGAIVLSYIEHSIELVGGSKGVWLRDKHIRMICFISPYRWKAIKRRLLSLPFLKMTIQTKLNITEYKINKKLFILAHAGYNIEKMSVEV